MEEAMMKKEENMKGKKCLFVVYCSIVVMLSIGWYPQKDTAGMTIKDIVAPISQKSNQMLCLVENGSFCYQGVSESSAETRMACVQKEELERREVKTILRYRITINMDNSRIVERIVEEEAGDQDVAGRQMVANVIINRIMSSEFPNNVKDVVFAHRQFSPVSNGSYYRVTVSSLTKKAVEKALKEKDNTKGALYFMYREGSSSSNVSWFDRDLTRLYKYGCHEFFK